MLKKLKIKDFRRILQKNFLIFKTKNKLISLIKLQNKRISQQHKLINNQNKLIETQNRQLKEYEPKNIDAYKNYISQCEKKCLDLDKYRVRDLFKIYNNIVILMNKKIIDKDTFERCGIIRNKFYREILIRLKYTGDRYNHEINIIKEELV